MYIYIYITFDRPPRGPIRLFNCTFLVLFVKTAGDQCTGKVWDAGPLGPSWGVNVDAKPSVL